MTDEEWRPVAGFTGYSVSNLGRVASFRRGTSRVLKGVVKSHGYLSHNLVGQDGRRFTRTTHSLVAEAFLGARPAGQLALHYDGDPLNNSVENLRWGTPTDNYWDAVRHGTQRVSPRRLLPRPRRRPDHCYRGHLLEPSNVLVWGDGKRRCRTCRLASVARWRATAAA